MKNQYKTEIITARAKPKVKEFYDQYRGLSSKVLENFFDQHKALQAMAYKKSQSDQKDK